MRRTPARFGVLILLLALLMPATVHGRGENPFFPKAQNAFDTGNLVNAQVLIARARAFAPADPSVQALEKKIQEAVGKAVEEGLREGEFFATAKNLPQAMTVFQRVLVLDPTNPTALRKVTELQQLLLQLEQYQKLGIQVDPSSGRGFDASLYSAIALMTSARESFDRGDFTSALKLVEQILAHEKNFREAVTLKDEIYQAMTFKSIADNLEQSGFKGDLTTVLSDLGKLMQLRPKQAQLFLWRGKIFLRQREFARAKEDFLTAFKWGTPFPEIRLPLAEAYAGMGVFPKAYAMGTFHPSWGSAANSSLLFDWYWASHRSACLLFLFAAGVLVYGLWSCLTRLYELMQTRPLGLLLRTGWHFFRASIGDPTKDPQNAWRLAQQWRTPWFFYYSGLLCIVAGRLDQARGFFHESQASPALRPRALYFQALLEGWESPSDESKLENRLQSCLLAVLGKTPLPWLPGFLRRLEEKTLAHLLGQFPHPPVFHHLLAEFMLRG